MAPIALIAALLSPGFAAVGGAPADAGDVTEAALMRCLDDSANASTAGQTECEGEAARAYDQRMNTAYAGLLRALPPEAGRQLRQAQRGWVAFRDADGLARNAIYATRQGTMYVPMRAAARTRVVRDRALQLETSLRILRIDG